MSVVTEERAGAGEPGERLRRTWTRPPGLVGYLSAVGHKQVGNRFVVTALVFFVVGGIEALIMRAQLARPDSDVVGPETYDQLFTMHGSTMMFLFAVPFMEGAANYLLPLMLGTRDLPFPRLNAFNYWTYLFGGLLLYSSFLFGEAPEGGWFAYPPLSGDEYLSGPGLDFWLIGITLAEFSAIGAGIELVVLVLKQRAPGMSLNRLPLFAWAMLATSLAIIFAFTALVVASVLLELDRKFGTHFYDPERGGDPVLWQHLFWIFGHPEVYIMFLPAAGIVSHVVQTFSRRPIVAYPLVALSIVATAFLSFGLWVHHMFTVGIPLISLGIFAAASYVITFPTAVQIFAWITTIWRGRPQFRTPMLFVVGFLLVFVVGGITGVMVASVAFDWQVHDTYFLVAHFHYVLIGGVVFPAFAGLYYWLPKVTGRMFHRGLSLWSFWLVFAGFNLTFFPMHLSGLFGMARRVYTYPAGVGLDGLNLASTIGAFVLALGFGASLASFASSVRGRAAGDDPWEGMGLEWATSSPPPPENFRRIPLITGSASDDVHGDSPEAHRRAVDGLAEEAVTWRAALGTTPTDAQPSEVIFIAGPTLWPLGAAVGLGVVAVGALVGALPVVAVGASAAAWCGSRWLLSTERERHAATAGVEVAGLPVDVTGPRATGWWALVLFLAVLVSAIGSLVFAYFFLRIKAAAWPPTGTELPPLGHAAGVTALVVVAALVGAAAAKTADRGGRPTLLLALGGLLGVAIAAAAVAAYGAAGVTRGTNAYGSLVFVLLGAMVVIAAVGAAISGLGACVAGGIGTQGRVRLLAGNARLYSGFAVVLWAVIGTTVYLGPRLS